MKTCTKCNLEKSLDLFYKNKRYKQGVEGWCKQCKSNYLKGRRAEINAQRPLTRHLPGNLEKHRLKGRKWRKANPERNKEIQKASAIRYRERDEEAYLTSRRNGQQRRRARIAQVAHTLTENEWQQLILVFDHRCAYCFQPKEKLEQDHIIPVSKGGEYTKENILPACRECNLKKKDSTLYEFYLKHIIGSDLKNQPLPEVAVL